MADDPQFEQALQQANALVTQGKWDEALALYQRLVRAQPQNVQLYQQIAQLADKKGDIPTAISAYLQWAQLCQSRGQHDDALKLYQQVLSMEGGSDKRGPFKGANPERVKEIIGQYKPEISLQMGSLLLHKNQADEAIKYLKLALDSPVGAQDSRVHTLLGIAYMQKSMDKEAIGEFQEVVRLAPNDAAFAYEKLGEIFIRGGKPPGSTIVWFRNAGDLYLRNEQWGDATRAYEMILSFEPRNKDVLNRLAEIYQQQGMRDKALDTYRNLAMIYTEEGLLDKVIILYEKLTELNPDDGESWQKLIDIYRGILTRDSSNLSVRLKLIKYLVMRGEVESAIPEYLALASAYMEKGIHDEAFQVIGKLLELDPQNIRAREMLGDVYMKREDNDKALAEYLTVVKLYRESGDEERGMAFSQKLLSIFPQEGELHYQMARSLKDQGAYLEALTELQQVLDKNPNHVPAMTDAAELLQALSRHEEARALLARILELEPDRADVRMQLLEFHLRTGNLELAQGQVDQVATLLQDRGLYREAEGLYRRLLAYFPENDDIREKICALRLAQGDTDRVVKEYLLLANMFLKRKLLERAAAMYQHILDHRPDMLNARYRLGRVMALRGEHAEALQHFKQLTAEYMKRNLASQALNVLEESVAIDADSVDLRERLVDLLVSQFRIEEATGHFKHLIRIHLTNGDVEEATRRLKEVVSLQPLHLDLRFDLATMYLEHNQLEQGQEILAELVTAYLQKKQISKVIDIYGKLAQIFRVQGRWDLYWQNRERAAELYRQEGQVGNAIAEYQEIIEAALRAGQFERANAIFPVLSDLYFSCDRAMDGVRAFERVAETFTRDGNTREATLAQDYLIQLLERKGDRGQALDLLLEIAERGLETGEREMALLTYGRIVSLLIAMNEIARAVGTQFIRVGILLRDRDLVGARNIFEEVRNLRPANGDDQNRFAELLYDAEYFEEALPMFVELMDRDPGNVDARARVAVIYSREGEMVQAARIARGLLSQGLLGRIVEEFKRSAVAGDEGETGLRLGAFYEEMGFYEEALREFQRAARQPRHTLSAYNAMAFLFRRAGYVELAIRQFMRTLEQPGYEDEDLLETRYNMAQLYLDAGKYMEALAMYNEVSAVKLRYRDVPEKIEHVSALIASGAKAEVIPFSPPQARPEESAAVEPPASATEPAALSAEAAVLETASGASPEEPPTVPEEAVASPDGEPPMEVVAIEESLLDEFAEAAAEPAEMAPLEESVAPTVESPAPEAEPPQAATAAEPVATHAETPAAATGAEHPLGGAADDDFFLEGPPPDASAS